MKLTPGDVDLTTLETIWRTEGAIELDRGAKADVERAAALVGKAAAGTEAVYGVNTGFGKLASRKIAPADTETLQRNLILSHCCGVGEALSAPLTRLMMVLKLMSLGRGASGVRWEVCALIEGMVNAGVMPVIPAQGSVGASGDLAPLAHMAAVMIGEGRAVYKGRGRGAGQGRACPRGAGPQGGARADQRHAVLYRLRAGRVVRGAERRTQLDGHRGA